MSVCPSMKYRESLLQNVIHFIFMIMVMFVTEDTVHMSMKILKRRDWTVQCCVIVFSVYNYYCRSCKSGHELSICNLFKKSMMFVLVHMTDGSRKHRLCLWKWGNKKLSSTETVGGRRKQTAKGRGRGTTK